MRIAIYARKSPHDDPKAESVERQVAHSREYADRKGWHVVDEHVYVDDSVSGAEFQNRRGLIRLLSASAEQPRPFDAVVMMESERLGRDTFRGPLAAIHLRDFGVRIFFYLTDEEEHIDTPEDELLLAIRGYRGASERNRAKLRTRDAHASRARKGFVTGGVVYGYRNVPVYVGTDSSGNAIRSHVVYAVNREEAEVVQGIFRMRADGYGVRMIARTLNADPSCSVESTRYFGGRGVPPPRKGSGSWAPGGVHAMLRNRRYLGQPTWGRFRNTDRGGRTRIRVEQDPSSWMNLDLPDLRIVDDETWQRVRTMDRGEKDRRSGRGQSSNRRPASLLSGLSACGTCGGPVRIAGSWKRNRCYGCAYHNDRGSSVCANNMLESVRVVDRRLVADIEAELLVPEARRHTFERAMEIIAGRIETRLQDLDGLRPRLATIDREIQNLVRAVEQAKEDELLQPLLDRIRERRHEKRELESRVRQLEDAGRVTELDLKRIERLVEDAVSRLGESLRSDLVTAKAALRSILVDRVIFHPDSEERGERTYLLETRLTLGNLISRVGRMSVNVPDGI